MAERIEKLFYELEARTEKLESQLNAARAKVAQSMEAHGAEAQRLTSVLNEETIKRLRFSGQTQEAELAQIRLGYNERIKLAKSSAEQEALERMKVTEVLSVRGKYAGIQITDRATEAKNLTSVLNEETIKRLRFSGQTQAAELTQIRLGYNERIIMARTAAEREALERMKIMELAYMRENQMKAAITTIAMPSGMGMGMGISKGGGGKEGIDRLFSPAISRGMINAVFKLYALRLGIEAVNVAIAAGDAIWKRFGGTQKESTDAIEQLDKIIRALPFGMGDFYSALSSVTEGLNGTTKAMNQLKDVTETYIKTKEIMDRIKAGTEKTKRETELIGTTSERKKELEYIWELQDRLGELNKEREKGKELEKAGKEELKEAQKKEFRWLATPSEHGKKLPEDIKNLKEAGQQKIDSARNVYRTIAEDEKAVRSKIQKMQRQDFVEMGKKGAEADKIFTDRLNAESLKEEKERDKRLIESKRIDKALRDISEESSVLQAQISRNFYEAERLQIEKKYNDLIKSETNFQIRLALEKKKGLELEKLIGEKKREEQKSIEDIENKRESELEKRRAKAQAESDQAREQFRSQNRFGATWEDTAKIQSLMKPGAWNRTKLGQDIAVSMGGGEKRTRLNSDVEKAIKKTAEATSAMMPKPGQNQYAIAG